MHKATAILALSVCALVATAPALAADYNSAATGSWSADATWTETGTPATSVDTAIIHTGHDIYYDSTLSTGVALSMEGGGVNFNRTFGASATPHPITVTGTGGTFRVTSGDRDFYGIFSGSGPLTLYSNDPNNEFRLKAASPSYSGEITVSGGRVDMEADGVLGTGTVRITGGYVRVDTAQTGAVALSGGYQIDSGGMLYVGQNPYHDIYLNGGELQVRNHVGTSADPLPIVVTADSTINLSHSSDDRYLYSPITNSGTLTMESGGTSAELRLGKASPNLGGKVLVPQGHVNIYADGAAGTATWVVAGEGSGAYMSVYANQTAGTGPAVVYVEQGGRFRSRNQNDWNVKLKGGTFTLVNDTVQTKLEAVGGYTSYYGHEKSNYGIAHDGEITGSGTLVFNIGGTSGTHVRLLHDSPDFTGDAVVMGTGRLEMEHERALGAGTAGSVTIRDGGRLMLNKAATFDKSIVLDGGRLHAYISGSITHTGTITVAADGGQIACGYGNQNDTYLDLEGKITGPGELTLTHRSNTGADGVIRVTCTANDYTGGTIVETPGTLQYVHGEFEVEVSESGQLGQAGTAGALSIRSGVLKTVPDDANDAVLGNLPAINVEGGTLALNSTETNTITLKEGGALRIDGGSTALDFTPTTGNVQIYHGAILADSAIAVGTPGTGDVQGAAAQNQVYRGTTSFTGEAWYGPGAGGNGGGSGQQIYLGLGTVSERLTVSGTVNEYTSGGGFSLYVQPDRDAVVNSSAALVATGNINFQGDGQYEIQGTPIADVAGTINKNGTGRLYVAGAGGLPAAKTLEVNGGYVTLGDAGAFAAGSQVDVNDTGRVVVGTALTSGSVSVKAGGGVYMGAADGLNDMISFDETGAQLLISVDSTTNLPTNGKVDFIFNGSGNSVERKVNENIILSDNTRIASSATPGRFRRLSGTGLIQATGSVARIANVAGDSYDVDIQLQLDLAGKTLIIGDDQPYGVMSSDGTGYAEASMTGGVRLNNGSSQVGTLQLADGVRCSAYNWSYFGTPSLVVLGDGATLDYKHGGSGSKTIPEGTTLRGNGQIRDDQHYTRTFDFDATTFQPGNSIGILTLGQDLGYHQFSAVGSPTPVNCTLEIEIASGGGAPGVDHDQLYSKGYVGQYSSDLRNLDVTVALINLPSVSLNPATMANMRIIRSVGAIDSDGGIGDIEMDYAATDSHWAFASAATVDKVAIGTYSVTLLADNIVWTAHKGDATLNEVVDVLDLARLANNFGKDVANGDDVTWATADFNLDGIVDVLDLAAIANNFGYDGTGGGDGGGAPVPEPASLAVLALGGVALLRRRRR